MRGVLGAGVLGSRVARGARLLGKHSNVARGFNRGAMFHDAVPADFISACD
jgi:hypothetical protein